MSRAVRPFILHREIAIIPLSQGYEAIVDADCVSLVGNWNWSVLISKRRNAKYACRVERKNGKQIMTLMHRVILNAARDRQIDHIDGNGLNNCRSNLRACLQSENVLNVGLRSDNSAGLKGVSFDHRCGKWKAEISRSGKRTYLGYFPSAEGAHAAYKQASLTIHGEFARSS